ncbi:MAG: hypothetical protein KGO46_05855, partial [Bacteroidetes bacterium]|nr:hypothetical protein [Bacteroidota bacterium]
LDGSIYIDIKANLLLIAMSCLVCGYAILYFKTPPSSVGFFMTARRNASCEEAMKNSVKKMEKVSR